MLHFKCQLVDGGMRWLRAVTESCPTAQGGGGVGWRDQDGSLLEMCGIRLVAHGRRSMIKCCAWLQKKHMVVVPHGARVQNPAPIVSTLRRVPAARI
ncbi:hypothetical protein HanRHA438_Chr10g0467181 [Helianthus annuus]|nr:hypothetical protein HanRHA438_Chr10g0467181 [Helianthus annuus]